MTGRVSRLVDRAVDSLIARDSHALVLSLQELAAADADELYAELMGLILDLADKWNEDALPEVDALGRSGASQIIVAIRARDVAAVQSAVGEDFGEIVTRLLATAAALKA